MHTLEQTQKLVWQLISDPHGVQAAIRKLALCELPIQGDHRLSAEERLDIYAQMYFFRLLNCLQEDFPAVRAFLGSESFAHVVANYVGSFPSEHWSLRYAGARLPDFLKSTEYHQISPFLSDLARFEWQLLDVIDAPDAKLLSQNRLAEISPEMWEKIKFSLLPSCRLLSLSWETAPLYEGLRPSLGSTVEKEEIMTPVKQEVTYLIWRPQFDVKYRVVDGLEHELLALLHNGVTFGELCEKAYDALGNVGVTNTAQLLQGWIKDGLLTNLDEAFYFKTDK
ncbi:MAG: hypothetical protein A3I05_09055 [Deltaproteobacteria bacterium RIFCSPLOWO2_02_FULL_44_10]|nr:MAG: hypothetical protein A3C46_08560 [Deltaproteobacteria bacterium RIFCSPHIGHO2_02_FULL_44_16]OGQ45251.1 MAG: hypothetical protein A3I05_09055 [Deltaproteobacteria bacterium RIFCSPLOWO2_02_FULL_44_10]